MWEYRAGEQTCQDWTFKEFNWLGKLTQTEQWIQGGIWSDLWKREESSFAEHRRYFPLPSNSVKIHLNIGNLVSIAAFSLNFISLDKWLNQSWIYLYILNMGRLSR